MYVDYEEFLDRWFSRAEREAGLLGYVGMPSKQRKLTKSARSESSKFLLSFPSPPTTSHRD
jgi:hypothetical protein